MSNIAISQGNGFAPANIDEAMRLAETLARSSMVPKNYQGKPEDILVATIWGKEIGLATMQALQNISVINGKPSVYGDAAMALVQASPVCEDVEEFFENEGSPNPVAVCIASRKGRKPVTVKFSVEDAKRAGLWGKQGPWSAYPKRMMQMRARGFALRDAFPDVLKGMITAEEAQDYPDETKPVAMAKPANPLDLVAPKKIEIPEQTTNPMLIEEAFSQDADAEELAVEVVEVEEAKPEQVRGTFGLFVPNKSEPHNQFATLEEWQDAYEDLADKTAKAGKVEPRNRMTILKELKLANDATLKSIDTVKRARHTAAHLQRLKALGAAQ
jgi:hypothetical protein